MGRFHLIPAIYILIVRDNKIFLLRRANSGWEDGKFAIVGGHIDGKETARQAAAREAFEETGIKVNIEDLHFVNVSHQLTDSERIHFAFVTKNWEGEPKNVEPEKASEAGWFDLDSLPNDLTDNSRQTIEWYKNNIPYTEFGWK